jgi:hypothetical protein
MYDFRMYIPFGGNIELLKTAVNSALPQMREYSSFAGKLIVVLNNSGKSISGILGDDVEIWDAPFELVHAQEANWMIDDAYKTGQPFLLATHTDVELLPGCIEEFIRVYEEKRNTKWYALGVGGPMFLAYNLDFFKKEGIVFDPFIFPFYFMDDHMERLALLRGWSNYIPHNVDETFILHKKSHYINDNPIEKKKNDITFDHFKAIYKNIWGGLPGHETVTDPYASGTLPRP